MSSPHKSVIVISSHVARGSVGNRAAVFALEILSVPVWAVPTIILPWHPGHGPATRLVPASEDFSGLLHDLANAPWINEVGAVLSGYMADEHQPEQVARLVETLKAQNPEISYLCDPVIGDVGGLYVPEQVAGSIRDSLLPLADIVTPNRYELAWLSDADVPATLDEALHLGKMMPVENVLATSCPGQSPGKTGNLLTRKSDRHAYLAEHDILENPPNGPGDLTAAVFLGHHLAGMDMVENLSRTTATVLEILNQSVKRGSNELTLESDAASILKPKELMAVRKL